MLFRIGDRDAAESRMASKASTGIAVRLALHGTAWRRMRPFCVNSCVKKIFSRDGPQLQNSCYPCLLEEWYHIILPFSLSFVWTVRLGCFAKALYDSSRFLFLLWHGELVAFRHNWSDSKMKNRQRRKVKRMLTMTIEFTIDLRICSLRRS